MNINLQLLSKYFLKSSIHNVLFNINKEEELNIDDVHISNLVTFLYKIVENKKEEDGLYDINNIQELLNYIGEFSYHKFKNHQDSFDNLDDYILFLYSNVALFLTSYTQEALNILKRIPKDFSQKIDKYLLFKISSYVDSYDARGLFHYLCLKYSLPYDTFQDKDIANYEYSEPSINKKWQKEYKQTGEPITFWFYKSILGNALFLVLFGPKCRYKMEKGGCAGCNLPTVSSSSTQINDDDMINQINNTFNYAISTREKASIKEVMLSNNGSILDPKTMSVSSLLFAVNRVLEEFPNLKKIIFETRIDDYTNIEQLGIIDKELKDKNSNVMLELAVGFEIFNDELRNGYYKKGLEKKIINKKLKVLSQYNFSLKVYMMYKAVPDRYMSVDESIEDLNNASNYFSDLSKEYGVPINLHISPTYLAQGTQLYKEYKNGTYSPPSTEDIDKMYKNLEINDHLTYYISMNDEGLGETKVTSEDYNAYLDLKHKIYQFNIENNRI